MKYSTAFIVLMIFAVTGSAIAQKKTITNADLEKYREARLKAELEYRENYARLGMPSPEENARRNEASRKELLELSATLRRQEIEREYSASQTASPTVVNINVDRAQAYQNGIAPAVIWGYYNRVRYAPRYFSKHQPQYYVSGGSIWPTGPRTPSRPLIRTRRR